MAYFPIRFFPKKPSFKFLRYRLLGFLFSGVLLAGSLFWVAVHGLNLGIDFTGGLLVEIRTEEPADLGQMRNILSGQEFGEVTLQHFGDEQEVLIRLQAGGENQARVAEDIKALLDAQIDNVDYRRVEYVGPTVGRELMQDGMLALGLALVAMMLYIWFRFEWQFGIGGIIALLHDSTALLGFYAIMGLDFGLPAIAAILTVIGYSINDSVVIYDRIRENLRKYKKMPMTDLLDVSVNETLSRTVLTGGTTLLALIALAYFGGEIIRGFTLAIAFGVVIGTYSSIFIAAPALLYLRVRNEDGEEEPAVATS